MALPFSPKKVLLALLAVVLGIIALVTLLLWLAHEPRPSGTPGPRAEALTDRMLGAIEAGAWHETGAMRWRLGDDRPLHLWDRQRGLVQVLYDQESPPVTVVFDVHTRRGLVLGEGVRPEDEEPRREQAYADWINDSFWMNAPARARDPGTSRALVERDGKQQLLVSYESGGVTPGDAYLWELDERGRPVAWRMWVGIVPVGGIRFTWEDWQELKTGAVVAREHSGPLGMTVRLDPLEAAATLSDLVGDDDPFLVLRDRSGGAPATQPADDEAR